MGLLEKVSLLVTPNAVKASKLYSVIPSSGTGDLTSTRNTTATRVNSLGLIESVAANLLRLNYDTVGGNASVLVEPQRTNLIPFSRDLTNSYWVKDNVTLSTSATLSPDNINTAFKIVENTNSTQHRLFSGLTLQTNVVSSYSFWVKQGERRYVYIRANIDANVGNNTNIIGFDSQSGNFDLIQSGVTAIAESYLNGWYRVSVSFNSLQQNPNFFIGMSNAAVTSNANPSYTGDGTSGLFLWNEQHELGATATSDIFTNGAAVTRNQDLISKTGISDLIGQTEGVFFLNIRRSLDVSVNRAISISDGTNDNRILVFYGIAASNPIFFNVTAQGISNQVQIASQNTFQKLAIRYSLTEISYWLDGVLRFQTTGTFVFNTLTRLGFDSNSGGSSFTGQCKEILIFKTALTDAECVSLTTI